MKADEGIIKLLKDINGKPCACGKPHVFDVDNIIVGKGALDRLAEFVKVYNAEKVFVLSDINTYRAAGIKVCGLLDKNEIQYISYVINDPNPEPDESSVGSVIMNFDPSCDLIVGVGSGVINDIGKILSNISGKPYIIAATAPSMDGFASATSSVTLSGLKVSLPSRCADVIIGDTDVLATAPDRMLWAGLGDMLAKYISICEWRISHIVTGEYYCEKVAELVRASLKICVDCADALMRRDDEALRAVFEGLVASGIAMNYAGLSRPASGVEHYFSHIWDMRGCEFGTSVDLHGIQCGVATLISLKLYEQIRKITPDSEKALKSAAEFDYAKWKTVLSEFVGTAAESMFQNEKKEHKYDAKNHESRLEIIIKRWLDILKIMDEELPEYSRIERIFDTVRAPKTPKEIGIDPEIVPLTFKATKDIRAKYVLSMLAWDLGILDEISFDGI